MGGELRNVEIRDGTRLGAPDVTRKVVLVRD